MGWEARRGSKKNLPQKKKKNRWKKILSRQVTLEKNHVQALKNYTRLIHAAPKFTSP